MVVFTEVVKAIIPPLRVIFFLDSLGILSSYWPTKCIELIALWRRFRIGVLYIAVALSFDHITS